MEDLEVDLALQYIFTDNKQEEKVRNRVNNLNNRFIKNLTNKRKEKGLSQYKLGEICGLTQQEISAIEKGDRHPTLGTLIKYLLGLGIDINKLFL